MAVLNIFVRSLFARIIFLGWGISWASERKKKANLNGGDWGLFRQVWAALKGESIKIWWIAGSCQGIRYKGAREGAVMGLRDRSRAEGVEGSGAARDDLPTWAVACIREIQPLLTCGLDRELYTPTFLSSCSLTTRWSFPVAKSKQKSEC